MNGLPLAVRASVAAVVLASWALAACHEDPPPLAAPPSRPVEAAPPQAPTPSPPTAGVPPATAPPAPGAIAVADIRAENADAVADALAKEIAEDDDAEAKE